MGEINLGSARIVTMRELSANAAAVVRDINKDGRPALVTKHGRFVAVLTPIAGVRVEAIAIEKMMDSLPQPDDLDDEMRESSADGADVARQLGLTWKQDD
ncbi:type II toxin-antitoxin system Phd/YefM family antitoxin [Streptomyces sp. CC210A]|uniref:type II toxin-antitoxin system Phd/YefM family antitoxin n=1 Tax=Streptomyces sp. CC210A TaxID=2898184 RepID=UPI001F2F138E|nr:type II toxin-antitoxin system Phd/YefM family antitoxin [Streptomyces sp. CC210A]